MVNLEELVNDPKGCGRKASRLQRQIAGETIKARGLRGLKQYGLFFASFWLYGVVAPTRARLIRSAYFWLRHIDDVADGDAQLPAEYAASKYEYLEKKLHLVRQLAQPEASLYSAIPAEKVDVLLVDYLAAAKKLGISVFEETLAILDTIKFDEERSRTRRAPTRAELDDYFSKLDFACINGALKVAGEPHSGEVLGDLSWVVRIWFNLRDFPKDVAKGIINISAEDIARHGVELEKCSGKLSEALRHEPLREWYREQLSKAQEHLKTAKQSLKETPFHWITRIPLTTRGAESFYNSCERLLNAYPSSSMC